MRSAGRQIADIAKTLDLSEEYVRASLVGLSLDGYSPDEEIRRAYRKGHDGFAAAIEAEIAASLARRETRLVAPRPTKLPQLRIGGDVA